jgi:hypothetical protein
MSDRDGRGSRRGDKRPGDTRREEKPKVGAEGLDWLVVGFYYVRVSPVSGWAFLTGPLGLDFVENRRMEIDRSICCDGSLVFFFFVFPFSRK